MPKKPMLSQVVKGRSNEAALEELDDGSDKDQIIELHRRLNDITRLVSDWVWETNAENKLTFLSQRVVEHLGYQPIELIGKNLQDLGQFLLSSGTVVQPNWRTPFRDFSFQEINKEGETKFFLISSLPVFHDDTGKFEGVRGTARDITESKKTEEAIRESEKKFRSLIDVSTQGILIHRNHKPLYCNQVFVDMHGYQSIEVILALESTSVFITPQSRLDSRHNFVLSGEESFADREAEAVRADGSTFWVNNRGFGIDWEGNRAVCSCSVDITEIKRTETALRESEERHRLFAADVAHELRTTLAIMRSQLDNMQDTKSVQTLRQDVDSMSRLISQMLTAARLEYLAVRPTDKVNIHAVCTDVAAYLAPFAVQQNRSIELLSVDGPIWANGDSDSLEQAVRNLVESAIKHTAEHTTVSISVSQHPAIEVSDKGNGIDAELRKKVFDRFWSSDRRIGGAGLGLSIVKRTVDAHGGKIELDKNSDGGAVFKIQLKSCQN